MGTDTGRSEERKNVRFVFMMTQVSFSRALRYVLRQQFSFEKRNIFSDPTICLE